MTGSRATAVTPWEISPTPQPNTTPPTPRCPLTLPSQPLHPSKLPKTSPRPEPMPGSSPPGGQTTSPSDLNTSTTSNPTAAPHPPSSSMFDQPKTGHESPSSVSSSARPTTTTTCSTVACAPQAPAHIALSRKIPPTTGSSAAQPTLTKEQCTPPHYGRWASLSQSPRPLDSSKFQPITTLQPPPP